MMTKRARRVRAIAPALLVLSVLFSPGAAEAATTPAFFSCAADAVTVRVAGGSTLNPVTTGGGKDACRTESVGLPNVGEAVSLEEIMTARTAYAETDQGGPRPFRSKPSAKSGVENLKVTLGNPVLGVAAARSAITATCASGTPTFQTSSEVASLSLAGQPIVLDGVLQPITDALTDAVGALVEVKLNEVVDLPGGGKAVRAARVTLLRGNAPLAEVIVAQSSLDLNGRACDPDDGDEPVDPGPSVCPHGRVPRRHPQPLRDQGDDDRRRPARQGPHRRHRDRHQRRPQALQEQVPARAPDRATP